MKLGDIICPDPDCGETVPYFRHHCQRCAGFVGFPNVRSAEAERGALVERYDLAKKECASRGTDGLLAKLELLADQSRPVIAMSFAACDDILRPGKYRTYHQRVESSERDPAGAANHSKREAIGARLFPMYHQQIVYAALSPDGSGLSSYGDVAVQWAVTPVYLGRRASLIEDNSYAFFEEFGLGDLDKPIPQGHRSTWQDRAKLVAAKLAPHLTTATREDQLPSLLMHAGKGKDEDVFVEVTIFADEGLDTRDVCGVTAQRPATGREDAHRLELVREMCANRGVPFVE